MKEIRWGKQFILKLNTAFNILIFEFHLFPDMHIYCEIISFAISQTLTKMSCLKSCKKCTRRRIFCHFLSSTIHSNMQRKTNGDRILDFMNDKVTKYGPLFLSLRIIATRPAYRMLITRVVLLIHVIIINEFQSVQNSLCGQVNDETFKTYKDHVIISVKIIPCFFEGVCVHFCHPMTSCLLRKFKTLTFIL